MPCVPECYIIPTPNLAKMTHYPGWTTFKKITIIPGIGWKCCLHLRKYFPRKEDFLPPHPQMIGANRCLLEPFFIKARAWHNLIDTCFEHFSLLLCGKRTVGGAVRIKWNEERTKERPGLGILCPPHLLVISKWKWKISWLKKECR